MPQVVLPRVSDEQSPGEELMLSQVEWLQLRDQDWIAARNVEIIFLSAFVLGLMGYVSILLWIFT